MTNNIYLKTNLELIEYLNSRFSDESLFIIDSNLNNLKIDEQVNAHVSYFDINEETKNLTSVEKIWDLLFQHNLNRSSEIVIIGGGVLLDVCAFASSTFKRGVSFTFVPSTLYQWLMHRMVERMDLTIHMVKIKSVPLLSRKV